MESQYAALQQVVVHGVALLQAQVFNPGAQQPGLDIEARSIDILIHGPAHGARAAAHPAQLVDRLQEIAYRFRIDLVFTGDQHRAAFVGNALPRVVGNQAAGIEVQVRIFLQLPAQYRGARQQHADCRHAE